MRLFLAFVSFILLGCATSSNAIAPCDLIDACSCKMSDGSGIVSLWELDGGSKPRFPKLKDKSLGSYYYSYNPCTPFTEGECKDVHFCQRGPASQFDAGSSNPVVTTLSGGLLFAYTSAPASSQKREVKITLLCNGSLSTPEVSTVTETPEYHYQFSIASKCACSGGCQQKSSSGNGSSGLSLGSVLCIVLLVLVVVYLVVGIIFNKYGRSKEGSEVIPNKEFWSDLPSLVKDGFVFTASKVKGERDQYQQL